MTTNAVSASAQHTAAPSSKAARHANSRLAAGSGGGGLEGRFAAGGLSGAGVGTDTGFGTVTDVRHCGHASERPAYVSGTLNLHWQDGQEHEIAINRLK